MAQDPDEIPLELSPELDPDLLQEFINDGRDHLDHIEESVLILEENAHDHKVINTIFRAFHTFKGNAGFLELTPISKLAHILESLLDQVRENKLEINLSIIDIIFQGRDTLKQYVDEIEAQATGKQPRQTIHIPTANLKATIQKILDGTPSAVEPPPIVTEVFPATKTIGKNPAQKPAAVPISNAVRVPTYKLDNLVDLAGELVIAESLISQNVSSGVPNQHALMRNLAHLNRISKELQRTAMSMRMVPIRSTFQKMHRLMRDIASKQKKDVQLILEGEDTEMDRTIIEKISDPLMHMIRNSVDHAIDTPSQRVASGKTPIGTIFLRAYHKSGNIIIEVEDDGIGLNRERILAKATKGGLISADEKPSDNELFNLIFLPGFSTAQVVTDVSGRGVGMDVVHRNIHKLRGKIDVKSVSGQGTKFTIRLPLTLAIIDGLIVNVDGQRYILSAASIRESFHPSSCKIVTLPGRGELVHMRNELIPLLRLRDHFKCKQKQDTEQSGIMIVIESDMQRRCLLVDAIIGKQEVVIKNLGEVFKMDPMVSGGAILGDGCIGLILDPAALVKLEHSDSESFDMVA